MKNVDNLLEQQKRETFHGPIKKNTKIIVPTKSISKIESFSGTL